ncbi:two-component system chemotaxis sensor kinase CheA [Azospirillum lipoferum]|uniref:Chemotaxis protein CheA n=1 Tax=Azospirillum lipoferum TaxID=193 RepID=A0A5A9GGQ7_AZOLI|nr:MULTISPECIES: chemotaxis protein CheA [Azospirillum]KAA0592902.1 chemotaxis protein CheA [Azospirillum lipoferum]MCP1614051.1 two-component system chemotaxis sensor kinase CheA [Azospirillum lipoferum]MDW5537559.1 chemotaxis protein CheA [Azospirillum sp. NL1]
MSELFDQFVVEAQELLETAGAALLALERDPADRASVDELFRAFHTLKGSSALFDMAPFTRLVHAGEDTLSLLRDGRRGMTPELADRLFRALDQCARWVAALEETGALPADAAAAETLVRGLSGGSADGDAAAGAGQPDGQSDAFPWVATLTGDERGAVGEGALTVIDYTPDPECFFTGDDPLALFRRVPDLRLMRIEPTEPLPPLAQMDPYRCILRFRALSGAGVEAVTPAFRSVPDQVRIGSVTLAPVVPSPVAAPPDSLAAAMLEEQARILDLPGGTAERQSRRAAVARTVTAILTALGRPAERAAVETACADGGTLRRFLADGPADKPTDAEPRPAAPAPSPAPRRALRVEPERMDALMALVGELSVMKGQLGPLVRRAGDGELARDMKAFSARLDSLVGDLRHAALRLRLLPLARVFDPLPRLVRDTARRLDKTVELVLEGAETEADKDILDVLGEPLLHLVRNALDHGIEAPERRTASGKPPGGTLRVRGFQDKGGVVVEVSDDGAGIDPAAMRRVAVAKGLLAPDAAAALGDDDAVRLVFAPGFSTAGSVSDLSGRGVGMDAVRAAVERAGGRVEIASTPGSGTRVRLALPLTLSITRVVVVEAAGSLYGIPVTLVGGVQRVPRADIHGVKRAESIVLRDRVVPLVRLRRLLGQPDDERVQGERQRAADCVVLAELSDGPVAVAVDDVGERADVVLRPMTGVLRGLRGYAGTAVLGDGRLILVLDLRELL